MRVLITGGAGFFGSRAAVHLRDVELHLLDRRGQDWSRVEQLKVEATRHEVDLLDATAMRQTVARIRPDVVVHLAWYAVPGTYLTSELNFAHVHAATELFLAARDAGCTRFCGAGTCFEYDTSLGIVREDSQIRPESIYAASKLATYLMLERAAAASKMSFAWMRFFYPYGPLEVAGRLVSSVIGEILAGRPAKVTPGEQLRDFIHIDDVGRAIATVVTSKFDGVVNVGSGSAVAVRDVVAEIARVADRPDLVELGALPYRAGDPMHVQADITRLKSLGFTPRYDIHDGLRDTVAFARSRSEAK